MNAPPPKSFPPDCHPASRVAKIKQRATSSKFTPPSNCQLSLRFYGEASSTIPATPYDDLRRGEKGRDRDSLPKGNLLFVVIARISARAFPIRPLFEAGTKALACEISQRPRANTLSVTLRPSPRSHERKTRFHARNCLVTRSRFVMAPLRLRGLTTIGTDVRICCVRARVCVCMHRWCGERRGKSRGERNRGDRSTSTNSRELDRGWEN